jgi:hypothetical protein
VGSEKDQSLEIALDSKEIVVVKAVKFRHAQKARIGAPLGKAKSDAKEQERDAALDLGYAVDEYEKTLVRKAASSGER